MSSLQKALKQSHDQAYSFNADSSCSDDDDDNSSVGTNEEHQQKDDMMKIRQQAFDLLNKSSGERSKSAHANRATSNNPRYVSYQQQSAGEQSCTAAGLPPSPSNPYSTHNPHMHPQSLTADQMSMKDLFVNCISEVCKNSSSEILSKGVALVSAGYKSVSNYGDKPVSGTFDSIDTSQHGYGNSSNKNHGIGRFPSRYQD